MHVGSSRSHRGRINTMKWTKEKPTAPGWYWYREPWRLGPDEEQQVSVRNVYVARDGELYVASEDPEGDADTLVATNDGEWAGPLSPPEE